MAGTKSQYSQTLEERRPLGQLRLILIFLPSSSFFVALKNKYMLRSRGDWCDMVVVQRKTRSQGVFGEVWPFGNVGHWQALE